MVNCKKCGKRISRKGVNCSVCNNNYHPVCGTISDAFLKEIESGSSEWKCPSCRRCSINKSIISLGVERTESVSSPQPDDNSNRMETTIHELMMEMKALGDMQNSAFNSMNDKILTLQALTTTVAAHDHRLDNLEKENKTMKTMLKS